MPHLTVRLFGKLSLTFDDETVHGLDACKLQELITYLLVFREAPHSRESLAALLWGDNSTAQSKKYLRHALWQLQRVLGSRAHNRDNSIFRVAPDWVSFNPDSDIWVDVAVFEQAFAVAREVAGKNLSAEQARTLDEAINIYRGDLLEGFYHDWCLCERERLQTNYLMMLDKMMSYSEAHEKYETGLGYGLRVLRYDRARESTHRRLMRLHYLSGDRTGALRQYEHCVAALSEELGVKPSRLTSALYDQIRMDDFQTAGSDVAVNSDHRVLPKVIDHLKQLRELLVRIRSEVHEDIKALDEVLDERK